MRRNTPTRILVLVACCLCFIVLAVVLVNLEPPSSREISNTPAPVQEPAIVAPPDQPAPSLPAQPGTGSTSALPVGSLETGANVSIVGEADLAYLKTKKLLIPVAGVSVKDLRDSFNDARSEGHTHQAMDIRASQGTEVLAAADGTTAKLFTSQRGGITLYERDSSGLYVYYYGHLQRYADGIYEGKLLTRGEVIGYVGDTGNAGAGNYHLHFGISKLNTPGKWSGGEPVNPYPLLTAR
jgi:murein DD-endopeptidase MepM/ murein hydrolase activator NlpD